MTVIVIIDSLRWSVAKDEAIMENLNEFETLEPAWANNNVTEASLMTILSGKHPLKHGICGLIQKNSESIVREQISLENWSMFSPAQLFKKGNAVGEFYQGKHFDQIESELLDADVSVLHVMDVHDYRDRGRWEEFYEGFQQLPESRVEERISQMDGWHVPWEERDDVNDDAGRLRAMYKAAANNVDEWLGDLKERCDEEGRTLIVTADHGECFGEADPYPQPVFRHVALWDSVLRVPLAVNEKIEIENQADHTDIRRLVAGESKLGGRDAVTSVEHSWQTGVRITRDEEYFMTWRENVFGYPNEIGNEELRDRALEAMARLPDTDPSMWELESGIVRKSINNIFDTLSE